jgi:hypothetical protein
MKTIVKAFLVSFGIFLICVPGFSYLGEIISKKMGIFREIRRTRGVLSFLSQDHGWMRALLWFRPKL